MIIYCFSSEDFGLKRLVYQDPFAPKMPKPSGRRGAPRRPAGRPRTRGTDPFEQGPKRPRKPMTPAQKEKIRAVRKKTREKLYGEGGTLDSTIQDTLDANKEAVAQFIEDSAEGGYESWKDWNEKFAAAIGVKGDPEPYVKALQRRIFREQGLGVGGDVSAHPDGKLGPYTLAALATHHNPTIEVEVPNPEGNSALAAVAEERKAEADVEEAEEADTIEQEQKSLKEIGIAVLGKDAILQSDGTYLVKTGEKNTYFRLKDGKWQWASQTEKDDQKWEDAGKDPYPEAEMAHVNDISDKLAKVEADTPVPPSLKTAAEKNPGKAYALRLICAKMGLNKKVHEPRIFNLLMSRVPDEPSVNTVRIALFLMGKNVLSKEELKIIFNVGKKKKTESKPAPAAAQAPKQEEDIPIYGPPLPPDYVEPKPAGAPKKRTWQFSFQYKDNDGVTVTSTVTGAGKNKAEAKKAALEKAKKQASHFLGQGEQVKLTKSEETTPKQVAERAAKAYSDWDPAQSA